MSKNRGFAAMDETRRRQIASRGGRAAHEAGSAHEWTGSEAAQAGRKGGQKVSQNREHMSAIGRKGGLAPRNRKAPTGEPNGASEHPIHENGAHANGTHANGAHAVGPELTQAPPPPPEQGDQEAAAER